MSTKNQAKSTLSFTGECLLILQLKIDPGKRDVLTCGGFRQTVEYCVNGTFLSDLKI